MLLFSSRGALDFPVPTRPVHRAVKLNQFPARIRPSRARQKVQTAFPARIRHSQARQKVQTAFLARIRHSQARHFATNCRPGTSIHPQTLLTDRCEVHFTALARVYVTFPLYRIICTFGKGSAPTAPKAKHRSAPFGRIRVVSVPKKGRDCWFRGIREVSVPEVGRDCRFPAIPRGLGAEEGTRLWVFGDFVWSRCRRWDETAWFPANPCGLGAEGGTRLLGFRRFRVVSVPKEGRDCRFRAISRGLGAGSGTRPRG